MGGGITVDENEFLTGGWTKPVYDAIGVQRVNWDQGGYKQKGKLVYVYLHFRTVDTASFWTNGGGGQIGYGLPAPSADYLDVTTDVPYVPLKGIIAGANAGNFFITKGNSTTIGVIFYSGVPKAMSGIHVIIKDVYLTD